MMEYIELHKKLNKPTKLWTVSDVEIWLQHLNMHVLYPRFKKFSIDGSCIEELQEEDLRNELGIQSSITIKKIMRWVKHDFRGFNKFIKNRESERNSLIEGSFNFLATHPKKKPNSQFNPSYHKQEQEETWANKEKRARLKYIEEDKCVVCFEAPRNCLFVDCKHFVVCLQCSKMLVCCPICRTNITQIQRIYLKC